ncbi:MAG: dipeptidase [Granulosicoccus sp.]
MNRQAPAIFDGHNDLLSKLLGEGGVAAAETVITGRQTHIDVAKAKRGGFTGGLFAIWIPSPESGLAFQELMQQSEYSVPLPPPIEQTIALSIAIEQASILYKLEALGFLRLCTTVAQIRQCMASGVIAAVMHMEGAEAIDTDLHALDVLHRAGLRSLGIVWSRPTAFGHGVPFRFPSTPDIGDGLTDAGVRLVARCNQLHILLDLSHLNEKGFWDVSKYSTQPLVASHSNAYAICPHPRNLTNEQLAAIRSSNGLVGLNFAAAFLREDGRMISDVPLTQMMRHLDHLIEHAGEDNVGLGSDFDGATIPDAIGDVTGLCPLREAMREHGYDEPLMEKLCSGNWLRVLEETWRNSDGET